MSQHKGMKRATKVATRARKQAEIAKAANFRRMERKAELAEKEAKEEGQKAK
jgi:hypothetical protein